MARGIIVQKYGGTSVADVQRIQNVARRVVKTKKAGYDVVVIVSALGDTTDKLIELAKQITSTPSERNTRPTNQGTSRKDFFSTT